MAKDFAVAIITTPLKFVGTDLKVVAYTPMKVSTMCLVLVESVFFRGRVVKELIHQSQSSTYLCLRWHHMVDVIKDHDRWLVPPGLRKPVREKFSESGHRLFGELRQVDGQRV